MAAWLAPLGGCPGSPALSLFALGPCLDLPFLLQHPLLPPSLPYHLPPPPKPSPLPAVCLNTAASNFPVLSLVRHVHPPPLVAFFYIVSIMAARCGCVPCRLRVAASLAPMFSLLPSSLLYIVVGRLPGGLPVSQTDCLFVYLFFGRNPSALGKMPGVHTDFFLKYIFFCRRRFSR